MKHGNDLILGHIKNGDGQPVRISREQRAMHMYMVGSTGTGKSKQLESCIRQDILAWPRSKCGLMFLDVHGALFDGVTDWMIARNLSHLPLYPIDFRRLDWVMTYNPLRPRPEEEADTAVLISGFVQAIAHAWGASDLSQTPRLAKWLRVMLATLYEQKGTLGEVLRLCRSPDYRRTLAEAVQDPIAKSVWQISGGMKEDVFQEQVESTVSRIVKFVSTRVMNATLCQTGISLDLATAVRRGAIIPVCLATAGGRIDSEDAHTFGSLLLSDLWTAAQCRGKKDADSQRGERPFYVYCDEFQEFITPTMATTLDQARGFGLHFTFAHQFPSQLINKGAYGQQIFDSIMANARTKLVFEIEHPKDLPVLSEWLFRNRVDVDQVKYRGYSTKVIGHELRMVEGYNRSVSNSVADGINWGDTESASQSLGLSETDTESSADSTGTNRGQTHTDGHSITHGDGTSESDSAAHGSQSNWNNAKNRSASENWNENETDSSGESNGSSLARSVSRNLGKPADALREQLDDQRADYDALLDTSAAANDGVLEGEVIDRPRDGGKVQRLDDATQGVTIGQTAGGNRSRSTGHAHGKGRGGGTSNGTSQSVGGGENQSNTHALARSRNRSLAESSSDGQSVGLSSTRTNSRSRSIAKSEVETLGTSHTEGGSRTETRGETNGTTLTPMLVPIMGREASTPVYRSVDEQLFMASQLLSAQPQRHCVLRVVGMRVPAVMVTPLVGQMYVTDKFRQRWFNRLFAKLPCAVPMPEALRLLAERQAMADAIPIDDEPRSNRRILPLSPPPQAAARRKAL